MKGVYNSEWDHVSVLDGHGCLSSFMSDYRVPASLFLNRRGCKRTIHVVTGRKETSHSQGIGGLICYLGISQHSVLFSLTAVAPIPYKQKQTGSYFK